MARAALRTSKNGLTYSVLVTCIEKDILLALALFLDVSLNTIRLASLKSRLEFLFREAVS